MIYKRGKWYHMDDTVNGVRYREPLKTTNWQEALRLEKELSIRRQSTKTDAGARVIPLNRDAVVALGKLWDRGRNVGSSEPEHFVFPACESWRINPARPMKSWRSAWRSLTKAAGLKGLRFHDLRHQAITELGESGQSDQTIMSIAGHVSREMLDHYSHIRLAAKRRAPQALETPLAEVDSQPAEKTEARPN